MLLLTMFLAACRHERKVSTSFYYWKTVYKHNQTEDSYLRHFHSANLYVRIMDIDRDEFNGQAVPVSPIVFKDSLPADLNIIPVVFIVNDILKEMSTAQIGSLAQHITGFVSAKVQQAGKKNFTELQIDCDWTATTRDNYFLLLDKLKDQPALKGKTISVTLRLHQLKNQKNSGIPPADKAMLMCYNMGNLRKYGTQNSILELSELKKYLGDNLKAYPLPVDIGLPLFSWAVAFRNQQYIGLSKRITGDTIKNQREFKPLNNSLYSVIKPLPQFGLQPNDVIRWEASTPAALQETAKYISRFLNNDTVNIIYFHLDETLLKNHLNARLETISNLLR